MYMFNLVEFWLFLSLRIKLCDEIFRIENKELLDEQSSDFLCRYAWINDNLKLELTHERNILKQNY